MQILHLSAEQRSLPPPLLQIQEKSKHLKGHQEPLVSDDEISVSQKMVTSIQFDPPVNDEICVSRKMITSLTCL